jgi:predicted RecA/RadA family phage recombinase
MAKNLIQNGDHITVVATAEAESGEGVLVGSLFGIASHDAAIGEDLTIATRGVYELPKISTQVWTLGALIYWDVGESKASNVQATGDVLIGVATAAASNPSDVGNVRLNGSFGAAA